MEQKYVIKDENVAYLDDYVFKEPKSIPEAHAATFEQIDNWFAHNVVEGADLGTFTVLGGYSITYWAKDRARAYHFEPSKAARNIRRIESKSLDRFATLEGGRFDEYAGDAERIYRHGRFIRGADAVTFRVMKNACKGEDAGEPSFDYARDKARVYYQGQPITDVSLETFAAIRLPGVGHTEYGVDGVSGFYESYRTGKMACIAFAELPEAVRTAYLDQLNDPHGRG